MRNNVKLLAWALLFTGGLATAALSAEGSQPDPAARATETALAAQQALQAAEQEIYTVKRSICKIDPHTGQVEVQTPQGLSTLSLTPDAAKRLQVGQPAVVELVPRQD